MAREDTAAQVGAIVVGVHTKVGTLLRNPEARVRSEVLVQIAAQTRRIPAPLSIRERASRRDEIVRNFFVAFIRIIASERVARTARITTRRWKTEAHAR